MDTLATIFTAVVTSGIVTTAITLYARVRERDELRRWELKREACLDALHIIDARFADYEWRDSDGSISKIDEQESISTADIRSCFNRLILACENSDVPRNFERCLNLDLGTNTPNSLTMSAVVDLRNSIRTELGFGKPLTTDVSWIKYINWKASDG
jgi:hypothetical protein